MNARVAAVLVLSLVACKKDNTPARVEPVPSSVATVAGAAIAPAESVTAVPPLTPAPSTISAKAKTKTTASATVATSAAPAAPAAKVGAVAGTSEVADGATLTELQKKRLLGHYSTFDAGSGFILDRTASPFKAKLDGVAGHHALSESGGALDTKEYRGGGIWLRIDKNGSVLLFRGPKQHEGVRVLRDADAAQLR